MIDADALQMADFVAGVGDVQSPALPIHRRRRAMVKPECAEVSSISRKAPLWPPTRRVA
jgi:hypothetical protein